MSLYENNLKAFAQHYPLTAAQLLQISENNRFEVFQDPNDPLNVNLYDHQKEAIFYQDIPQKTILNQIDFYEDKYSRYPVLFIYGVSNGLFLKLLLQNQNHQFIIVIEPELELLFIAFNLIDFTKEIDDKRIHFFLDEQMDFARASGIFSDSQIKVFSKTYHLEPNSDYYENHHSESLIRINSIMTRAIEHVVIGLGNDSVDALTGLEWHLANLETMVKTPTLLELVKKAKTTQTAVIVSTGPSLSKQLPLLQSIKNNVTVLSVDASLPILEQYNIKPDIVFSIERVPLTAQFYRKTSKEFKNDIICAISSISHPVLVGNVEGTIMQMSMRPFGYTRYFDLPGYGYIGIGMSAANMAYELAYHAGFQTIILIGQDLAYGEDGQSHSDGHILHTIKQKESDVYVESYRGKGQIRTSLLWNMFRNFFENDIQTANSEGIITINATEGGARIHGALEISFNEAIDRYIDQSVKKERIHLDNVSSELIEKNWEKAQNKLACMQEYVTRMQQKVSTLFEKVAAATEKLDQKKARINPEKVDYDYLAQLMGEIDEIKGHFDEQEFVDIFIDATQALIVHQELELARLQVRPIQTDDDRRLKMIDWIYAHKTWLFSLAGIMEAERMVIERRGADAYILRDAEIVANRVSGYIVDLKNISKRFDVDLVIDGEIVEQKMANQLLHHHLLDQPCEGRFNFEIPERFFDNQVHTIYIRDKDSGIYLNYEVKPIILLETMKTYGQVFEKSKVSYHGWCKKTFENQLKNIDVFIDNVYLKTITAERNIAEFEYTLGIANFGFDFVIPTQYFDNKTHKIQFYSSENSLLLEGGNLEFTVNEKLLNEQYEADFWASLELYRNSDQILSIAQKSIGFFATKEMIVCDEWNSYIKKLLSYDRDIKLHIFYFTDLNELKKNYEGFNEQIIYTIPKGIEDIVSSIQFYINPLDFYDYHKKCLHDLFSKYFTDIYILNFELRYMRMTMDDYYQQFCDVNKWTQLFTKLGIDKVRINTLEDVDLYLISFLMNENIDQIQLPDKSFCAGELYYIRNFVKLISSSEYRKNYSYFLTAYNQVFIQ